uniref:Uncharacterized protein n=1 Tax=Salix viminalis TaxID=40686 RepID=A0A6N2MG50_SALVM
MVLFISCIKAFHEAKLPGSASEMYNSSEDHFSHVSFIKRQLLHSISSRSTAFGNIDSGLHIRSNMCWVNIVLDGASFDNEKTQREQVNENAKHCDAHAQLGNKIKEWLHNEKLAIESKRKESPFFTRREKFKNEFLRRIVPWEKLRVSWIIFPTTSSNQSSFEHTKNILVECVASHLKHKKCTTSYGARLSSSSGRIMLQSVPGTELYRERTVKALARDLQVPLLVLDSSVLAPYDFDEDESESDDSAGSVEETCSESEVEDDNDAVNEEEWTGSAEAKSDCIDNDAVDLEANAEGKNIDRRDGGKTNSTHVENESFVFATRSQDNGLQKAVKTSMNLGGNELSKFSDTPRDASLDDLFHPLDKNPEDRAAEASTSASTSHMNQGNAVVVDAGKNDLATRLRATIAQKQMENEMGQTNGGGDLFSLMMGVLKDGVIDIDGLVFDEKLPPENLFPLQSDAAKAGILKYEAAQSAVALNAVEFSRLVGLLRPEESERPEQKIVFITQHGLLPLMELLEVPKTRVIFSVLQLINQIVKDNTDFQENACLVGLVSDCTSKIPVVMSFAGPDRPVRFAWRQLISCSSYANQGGDSLTLQMFIACRGIPILVGFLEADHAKDMVHLAIDGMWQVFKLQRSTPRNDFCRIAAKNGILFRLVNTLYSLNEATRLAHISGTDTDGPQSSNETIEAAVSSKLPDPAAIGKAANMGIKEPAGIVSKEQDTLDQWKSDPSRPEIEFRQPRSEQVRPLLSLLEKEPPSKHFSGQLEYARHLSGLERHESILPLLHASEKKTNGELDFLMTEFAGCRGSSPCRGGVENDGLWWPKGALEAVGLCCVRCLPLQLSRLELLAGAGEEGWDSAAVDGAKEELLAWWSTGAGAATGFFLERENSVGERESYLQRAATEERELCFMRKMKIVAVGCTLCLRLLPLGLRGVLWLFLHFCRKHRGSVPCKEPLQGCSCTVLVGKHTRQGGLRWKTYYLDWWLENTLDKEDRDEKRTILIGGWKTQSNERKGMAKKRTILMDG